MFNFHFWVQRPHLTIQSTTDEQNPTFFSFLTICYSQMCHNKKRSVAIFLFHHNFKRNEWTLSFLFGASVIVWMIVLLVVCLAIKTDEVTSNQQPKLTDLDCGLNLQNKLRNKEDEEEPLGCLHLLLEEMKTISTDVLPFMAKKGLERTSDIVSIYCLTLKSCAKWD